MFLEFAAIPALEFNCSTASWEMVQHGTQRHWFNVQSQVKVNSFHAFKTSTADQSKILKKQQLWRKIEHLNNIRVKIYLNSNSGERRLVFSGDLKGSKSLSSSWRLFQRLEGSAPLFFSLDLGTPGSIRSVGRSALTGAWQCNSLHYKNKKQNLKPHPERNS